MPKSTPKKCKKPEVNLNEEKTICKAPQPQKHQQIQYADLTQQHRQKRSKTKQSSSDTDCDFSEIPKAQTAYRNNSTGRIQRGNQISTPIRIFHDTYELYFNTKQLKFLLYPSLEIDNMNKEKRIKLANALIARQWTILLQNPQMKEVYFKLYPCRNYFPYSNVMIQMSGHIKSQLQVANELEVEKLLQISSKSRLNEWYQMDLSNNYSFRFNPTSTTSQIFYCIDRDIKKIEGLCGIGKTTAAALKTELKNIELNYFLDISMEQQKTYKQISHCQSVEKYFYISFPSTIFKEPNLTHEICLKLINQCLNIQGLSINSEQTTVLSIIHTIKRFYNEKGVKLVIIIDDIATISQLVQDSFQTNENIEQIKCDRPQNVHELQFEKKRLAGIKILILQFAEIIQALKDVPDRSFILLSANTEWVKLEEYREKIDSRVKFHELYKEKQIYSINDLKKRNQVRYFSEKLESFWMEIQQALIEIHSSKSKFNEEIQFKKEINYKQALLVYRQVFLEYFNCETLERSNNPTKFHWLTNKSIKEIVKQTRLEILKAQYVQLSNFQSPKFNDFLKNLRTSFSDRRYYFQDNVKFKDGQFLIKSLYAHLDLIDLIQKFILRHKEDISLETMTQFVVPYNENIMKYISRQHIRRSQGFNKIIIFDNPIKVLEELERIKSYIFSRINGPSIEQFIICKPDLRLKHVNFYGQLFDSCFAEMLHLNKYSIMISSFKKIVRSKRIDEQDINNLQFRIQQNIGFYQFNSSSSKENKLNFRQKFKLILEKCLQTKNTYISGFPLGNTTDSYSTNSQGIDGVILKFSTSEDSFECYTIDVTMASTPASYTQKIKKITGMYKGIIKNEEQLVKNEPDIKKIAFKHAIIGQQAFLRKKPYQDVDIPVQILFVSINSFVLHAMCENGVKMLQTLQTLKYISRVMSNPANTSKPKKKQKMKQEKVEKRQVSEE